MALRVIGRFNLWCYNMHVLCGNSYSVSRPYNLFTSHRNKDVSFALDSKLSQECRVDTVSLRNHGRNNVTNVTRIS